MKNGPYENISSDVLQQSLVAAGMPSDYVDFLLYTLGALRKAHSARMTSAVADILGRQPIGVDTYTNDYRNACL